MRRRFLCWFLLCIAGISACTPTTPSSAISSPDLPPKVADQSLTVFAASSLTEAFMELGERFSEENPGGKITFNFAGSQQLAQQLAQGAPADVFASADRKQMDAAVQTGRVATDSPKPFAQNRLTLVFPKDNPAGISQLRDLTKAGLKLVLAAEVVPVGRYSLDFLEKASQNPDFGSHFKGDVLQNVVSYEENTRAVLSKIVLGEADAGIVFVSDVSQVNPDSVGSLDIPDELNVVAEYYIAPINDSRFPEMAKDLIDFVLSPTGQDILARYGFIRVK